MNTTSTMVDDTSGMATSPEVRTSGVTTLLRQSAWEIWHFSGYMLASG